MFGEQSAIGDLPPSVQLEGDYESFIAVRTSPRLYVHDGFVSPDEIAHILAITSDLDAWAAAGLIVKRDETGASFELPVAHDPVLRAVTGRTYALLGVENKVDFSVRFRRYGVGEWHPPHTDTYQMGDASLVATAMVILQGPEAGGETEFPWASPPVMVPARTGRLVAWLNHLPSGEEDPLAYHASRAIESGTKITITNFIYADAACRLVTEGPAALAR